ncbi:hypothetical protein ACH5RR_015054 [Cinchona calisaya]|uniref:Uncharacterized protein n=1 Tax=Cinchona calisaya TaxID=153742 RepID=A0ABD2ZV57_9GENT
MSPSKSLILVIFLIIFLTSQEQVSAIKKSYVVYLGAHSHGPNATVDDFDRATNSHHEFLGSFLGSKEDAKGAMFYSYQKHINGFAAILEEKVAAKIAKHPNVVSVFLNGGAKLQTTHSWKFLGLEDDNGVVPPESIWNKANFGQDVIIANFDSGVWPESRSFSDEGFGPIPSKWKGSCQNTTVPCNRKLIGAKYFNNGYLSMGARVEPWMNNARDHEGHGTHTLSTAGGNFVPGANMLGFAEGTAKGGAPKARVASYKTCWPKFLFNNPVECYDADMMQAFDEAIHDGVDVISLSVLENKGFIYSQSAIAIGAFHALMNNIVVVAAAGNEGPRPKTVKNIAPWIFTVGASTMDRDFLSFIDLPTRQTFMGRSLSPSLPNKGYYPLIDAAQAYAPYSSPYEAIFCRRGTLDQQKVQGKILVCLTGQNSNAEKGEVAAQAGAVGMIIRNDEYFGDIIDAFPHVLPAIHIGYNEGVLLLSYINSVSDPVGYIRPPTTAMRLTPAPTVATFSSRGPNWVTPEILKPDITAPGFYILASNTGDSSPTSLDSDKRRTSFTIMYGTSMACPHVAGMVALLKALHPDWSPAAIRSAIMTTAQIGDNTMNIMREMDLERATPFGFGAGHMVPNSAMDPGLVYDLTVTDHLNFLCANGYSESQISLFARGPYYCPERFSLYKFNYPSLVAPNLIAGYSVTLTRTLKNVGSPGTYTAHINSPPGVTFYLEPYRLTFEEIGVERSFRLTLQTNYPNLGKVFGDLTWSDGYHYVRSPIVVTSD